MSHDLQQAITHVLQQDSQVIGSILNKLKQLQDLQTLLFSYLEEKLTKHCLVANFENNCLSVITDNALWATRFRFQIPALITALRQHEELKGLQELRCLIRPKQSSTLVEKYTPIERMSLETSKIFLETAKTIKHHSLKKIMEKIAQNT